MSEEVAEWPGVWVGYDDLRITIDPSAIAIGRVYRTWQSRKPAHTNGYRRQRRKRGYQHWPSKRWTTPVSEMFKGAAAAQPTRAQRP